MTSHQAILDQSIGWASRRRLEELMQLTAMKPQEKHTSLQLTDTGGKI